MLVSGSPFHEDKSEDDGCHDAEGGGCHGQCQDFIVSQLAESLADGCCRSMAAAESAGHGDAETRTQWPDLVQYQQSQQSAKSPLEQQACLGISPHGADFLAASFRLFRGEREGAKDECYQDAGIGASLVGDGEDVESVWT